MTPTSRVAIIGGAQIAVTLLRRRASFAKTATGQRVTPEENAGLRAAPN